MFPPFADARDRMYITNLLHGSAGVLDLQLESSDECNVVISSLVLVL